jgi:prepilin-type N-terminal cleavage/methylation domain-containing protein
MRLEILEKSNRWKRQGGFSLIELMVTVAILLMVMAGVFGEVGKMQKVSRDEDLKRELFQNAREFMDQFARDAHASGAPNVRQFSIGGAALADTDNRVAVGLVKVSSTEVIFEGDVHGDGLVDSVGYRYVATAAGFSCPCLQRSEINKANGVSPSAQNVAPNYYVALENVLAPTAGTPIFTFFDISGNQVNAGGGAIDISTTANTTTIATIRSVRVFINVQASTPDLELARRTASSLTQEVRFNNF